MDNKYLVNGNEAEGKVKISEDVIATVASVAAESVDGVVKVGSNFKSQVTDILNTKISIGASELILAKEKLL